MDFDFLLLKRENMFFQKKKTANKKLTATKASEN